MGCLYLVHLHMYVLIAGPDTCRAYKAAPVMDFRGYIDFYRFWQFSIHSVSTNNEKYFNCGLTIVCRIETFDWYSLCSFFSSLLFLIFILNYIFSWPFYNLFLWVSEYLNQSPINSILQCNLPSHPPTKGFTAGSYFRLDP